MQLEYAHKGDVSKMKRTLSSKLANFQHPQTQDSPLVSMSQLVGVVNDNVVGVVSHSIVL